jgi:hypothetical protein
MTFVLFFNSGAAGTTTDLSVSVRIGTSLLDGIPVFDRHFGHDRLDFGGIG